MRKSGLTEYDEMVGAIAEVVRSLGKAEVPAGLVISDETRLADDLKLDSLAVMDFVMALENRFDLVMLAAHRSREIAAGSAITIDRDNDKNPVVALREIADETQPVDELRERMIESTQTQIEVDEPEDDAMALLLGAEVDRPRPVSEENEERVLRMMLEANERG